MDDGGGGGGGSKKLCGLIDVSGDVFDYINRFLCEFIGTLLLVLLGCMGCVSSFHHPNSYLQMNINFGLVVMMVLQCYCFISGSHINPAITLAAAILKKITIVMALVYFIAQMLGACVGYLLLTVIIPKYHTNFGFCIVKIHPELSIGQGIAIEFIITFVLITICASVWDPRNADFMDSVTIRFGLAITSLALTAGSFTGGCMNPARAFGPAVYHMDFQDHYVYWIGPLAGSLVAAFLFKGVMAAE